MRGIGRCSKRAFGALIAAHLCATAVWPEPYVPREPGEVVERLPLRQSKPGRSLRKDQPAAATRLAREYLEIARREGDPRYVGYAEGVLQPWWTDDSVTAETRIVRAMILQYEHRFPEAIADLEKATAEAPRNGEALLIKAYILITTGEFNQARRICAALIRLNGTGIPSLLCSAAHSQATGMWERTQNLLKASLSQISTESGALLSALTSLAETSALQGELENAEQYYRKALLLSPRDQYLLGSYADFLLEQKRYADITSLLEGKAHTGPLRLRLLIGERRLRGRADPLTIQQLEGGLTPAAGFPDAHKREEAMFLLCLKDEPLRALQAAEANWALQREDIDAALLVESAIAAGKPEKLELIRSWAKEMQVSEKKLSRLLRSSMWGSA